MCKPVIGQVYLMRRYGENDLIWMVEIVYSKVVDNLTLYLAVMLHDNGIKSYEQAGTTWLTENGCSIVRDINRHDDRFYLTRKSRSKLFKQNQPIP